MYELVNTSLPNGLIAGTHGFATVAMTKGVQDVLRGRLEALCAYTHRTSVHDASYYQQNPVNWFHVMLPQGEHVIGRVAPSDFDYTGRTNRLARIRVFGANEMPDVGGAEILIREKCWFAQPWEGLPRYLDEDRNTCGHLRMLNPLRTTSAPAWDAVFGSGGSRYAQQVAWQIEKNLVAGGKAVYFKTSTAWDVSGEKLLGLFVDVINLLPVESRARVTFSTYPVSLPVGTGCNLRGIYDRDKFFDASSATQAWVDCENAKIVHEELLPTSGTLKSTGTSSEKSERSVGGGADDHPQVGSAAPKPCIRRSQSSGGDPYAYRNLIAPQKKGPDMFIVGLAVAGAVVLLAAGGFFFWMMQRNKQQMKDSGAAAAVEAEIKSIESEKEQQERLAKEKRDAARKEALEQAAKESAEKEAVARKVKAEQEAAKNREKERAEKEAKAEAELSMAKKRQSVAYLDAKEFRRGYPSYDYDSIKRKCKEPFVVEEGCCVYYYLGSVVTNEPAGFKVINENNPNYARLRWGEGLGKRPDDIPLVRNGFVLWYNPSSKRVYIDLNRRMGQNGDGEPWFSDSDSVDLSQKYFGPDPHFEEMWRKSRDNKKTKYLIDWKFNDKCRSAKPIPTEKVIWTDTEMIAEMQKRAVKDFDEAIALAKLKEPKLQKDLDEKLMPELGRLQSETNSMWEVWRAYQGEAAKIATLSSETKALKKMKPKNWESDKEKKEKEIQECKGRQSDMLAEGLAKPTGKTIKGIKAYANIVDLESKIKSKESAVDMKQKEVDVKRAQIDKAKSDVQSAIQSKEVFLEKFKDNIRKVLFTLRVEGETIEE